MGRRADVESLGAKIRFRYARAPLGALTQSQSKQSEIRVHRAPPPLRQSRVSIRSGDDSSRRRKKKKSTIFVLMSAGAVAIAVRVPATPLRHRNHRVPLDSVFPLDLRNSEQSDSPQNKGAELPGLLEILRSLREEAAAPRVPN